MNHEWSLDILYTGYDDPEFQKDKKLFEELIAAAPEQMEKAKKEGPEAAIQLMETVYSLANKLAEFISLKNAVNTADGETNDELANFERVAAGMTAAQVSFEKYVASIEDLDAVIAKSPLLTEYAYLLKKTKKKAEHLLSDELEVMISKMNLSGGAAWARLFSFLTSGLKVDYKGETKNLSSIRNLAYDADPETRKSAYEAELAGYAKIEDSIAFSLNHIKSQVTMLSKERGYESPLAMTLEQCGMKRETLDAMFTAMKEYFPKFWEYLKAKSHYLGHEGSLPWYDLFAPVGTIKETFTVETARETLVKSFEEFSPEMSDMMTRAFEDGWIDFAPHDGKVGGAFCAGIESAKQSRILTNFDGSFDSVDTLAHELGHAFHGQQVFENRILNQEYSMPVAETASTFNETHFMLSMLEKMEDPGEKLAVLESVLMGAAQILCDIYSRFLFEDAVFGSCENKFLMPADLKKIMLQAQKEAYGDGLDETFLHPYMWTCKGHYYDAELSYYNFPYAFGGLFAMGLYAQYQKEGDAFVPKYKALLKATPVCSVEETAQMAGVDLTTPDFWRSSLQMYAKLVDEYVELTRK